MKSTAPFDSSTVLSVSPPMNLPLQQLTLETTTKKLSFSKIIIREYSQTLGDNPSAKNGPPLSLDWDYVENDALDIDHYEVNRKPRRSKKEMMMNMNQKKTILKNCSDVTAEQIMRVEMEMARIKRERIWTFTQVKTMNAAPRADRVMNAAASRKSSKSANRGANLGRRSMVSRAA